MLRNRNQYSAIKEYDSLYPLDLFNFFDIISSPQLTNIHSAQYSLKRIYDIYNQTIHSKENELQRCLSNNEIKQLTSGIVGGLTNILKMQNRHGSFDTIN